MFKVPNGDEFPSKKVYQDYMLGLNKRRQRVLYAGKQKLEQRKSYNLGTSSKNKCPKCSRVDYLTRDYRGSLMCSSCFRNSL